MNASESHTRSSVRRKGLVRFVIGLSIFAVGLTIPVFVLPYFHHQLTPTGTIPFALPGAYALSGLVELITGVSFFELARRWDELKRWQRGVFGTFNVAAAIIIIIAVGGFLASRL